jgi:hypothetical protein
MSFHYIYGWHGQGLKTRQKSVGFHENQENQPVEIIKLKFVKKDSLKRIVVKTSQR